MIAKVEAARQKWTLLYGDEGAGWLMLMLDELYRERPLTIEQAIFAVNQWGRTSELLYQEVGVERLREYQQLALATVHPHVELRLMYLSTVAGA